MLSTRSALPLWLTLSLLAGLTTALIADGAAAPNLPPFESNGPSPQGRGNGES